MKMKGYASFIRGYYIGLFYIAKAMLAILRFAFANRKLKK